MKKNFWILLICAFPVFAEAEITPYEWEKDRSRYKLTPEESKLSEIVLKQHVQYDNMCSMSMFLKTTSS
jgi:hypothetical protein